MQENELITEDIVNILKKVAFVCVCSWLLHALCGRGLARGQLAALQVHSRTTAVRDPLEIILKIQLSLMARMAASRKR
jgi:hypothetical protein